MLRSYFVFSKIVFIISLPSRDASGNLGAKYDWIRSNRSRYDSKSPNDTQSDHACQFNVSLR